MIASLANGIIPIHRIKGYSLITIVVALTDTEGAHTNKKPRYFYGWNIVIASSLAGLAYAERFTSLLGLFFKPLQNEFGWSRSAVAGVQSISQAAEAAIAPIVGPLIDRYGARVLMPVGAIIVGLAMILVTQINSIWQFYLLRGAIVAIGFTLMGGLVSSVTINNWFVRKRGRALAISHAAGNFGNVILSPVSVFVIAASGWRTMFVVFAVVTWLLVTIPSAILMRRRPEDMGLLPDGAEQPTTKTSSQSEHSRIAITEPSEPVWTRREAMATASFWLLAATFGVSNMAFQAINISLVPYVQDLGYVNTMVAAIITFRAIIMSVGGFVMGFVAEHSGKGLIRISPLIIQIFSALLFLTADKPALLWLAITLYGFGAAGVLVSQEVIWANYFGRFSLGSVRSIGFLMSMGFGAIGPVAMNALFDLTGSYRLAFIILSGIFLLASFLLFIVRPTKAKRYATATEMMALQKAKRV